MPKRHAATDGRPPRSQAKYSSVADASKDNKTDLSDSGLAVAVSVISTIRFRRPAVE